ncbi:MAG: hypothetical protein E7398_00230 [Ruminococcaceae bacterium]|nr:hypothetical protein [Oscillospiraceae bacterium]
MKIDFSSIEGYENMTAEEKLAALEAMDIPEPDYTGWVKKDVADKYASEAAGYKKQLREKMSQDEQEAAQLKEELAAVKTEVESLRQEKAETELTKRWMGIGYSEELATATAKASASGDMDTVFKNHAKFLADREKELKSELLKKTPTPPAGDGDKKITKEDFSKMSLAEKQKFATENPEAYKEIYSHKEE